MERRLPPYGVRRADGKIRSVLLGLLRHAAGTRLHGHARLSLSGAALRLAEEAARNVDARARAAGVRELSSEPRPDCEFGARRAHARANIARPPARADGAASAR